MSEVTEAHSSTDGESDGGPHVDDDGSESYSGYLCGVCEEPLPYGAATCIACGTPVAPLDDEEMVAGPYVFGDPATGDLVAVSVEDDPYAPPGDEAADATAAGEDFEHGQHLRGADISGGEPDALDHFESRRDDATPDSDDLPDAPRPAPISVMPYEAGPPAGGNGAGDHDAEADGGYDESVRPHEPVGPPPVAVAGDPADALGIERTPYAGPAVSDPGPDPMLGRAPTAPVLSPPPPLPYVTPQDPAPPGLSGLRGQQPAAGDGGRRGQQPAGGDGGRRRAPEPRSGPVTPLVVGAVLLVFTLLGAGAFIVSRGGTDSAGTAPSTTVARPPAPAPTARTPVVSEPTGVSTTKGPDIALFCVAANQFRLDPNPDSVAAKFLAKPEQLTATIEAMVANAPADARPRLAPLKDAVNTLADRVEGGEITTVAQLRTAVDSATQAPAWPRFDQVIGPAVLQHC